LANGKDIAVLLVGENVQFQEKFLHSREKPKKKKKFFKIKGLISYGFLISKNFSG